MKGYFYLSIIFFSLFLASCKKDWTCECYIQFNGVNVGDPVVEIINDKKGVAKEKCESKSIVYGTTGGLNCKIK